MIANEEIEIEETKKMNTVANELQPPFLTNE